MVVRVTRPGGRSGSVRRPIPRSVRRCSGAPDCAFQLTSALFETPTRQILKTSEVTDILANDESVISLAQPSAVAYFNLLTEVPEFIAALTANDHALARVIRAHPGLLDLVENQYDRNSRSEDYRAFADPLLKLAAGNGDTLKLLVANPNVRLTANHWHRLLHTPGFVETLARDPIFAKAVTQNTKLLVDIAGSALPETTADQLFGAGDAETGAEKDGHSLDNLAKVRKARLTALVSGQERVLLDDGVEVAPGEATQVDYVLRGDAKKAAKLLDEVAPKETHADLRRRLVDARKFLSQHPSILEPARKRPGLARAVLKAPALGDFLAESPELVALLDRPDAAVVIATMNVSPDVFTALKNHPPLYRNYVSDAIHRENLRVRDYSGDDDRQPRVPISDRRSAAAGNAPAEPREGLTTRRKESCDHGGAGS